MDAIILLLRITVIIVTLAGLGQVFEKAGEPAIAAFIPIYNFLVSIRIANISPWWAITIIIPPIFLMVVFLLIPFGIAKRFGKSPIIYGFGLMFLPFIFYPILGFGNAQYRHEISNKPE